MHEAHAASFVLRYDPEFLLQFMQVCREKPPHLLPPDALGIARIDQMSYAAMCEGPGGHNRPLSAGVSASDARSAPIGLGIAGFERSVPPNSFMMGQFPTPGSKLASEECFMIPLGVRSASVGSGPAVVFQGECVSHSQPRPPPKAGDLSQFGKISKVTMVMGPSSVFTKKDSKRKSKTRTNSSSNMFSMLNTELVETKPSRAPSRRPNTDLDKPEPTPQRRKVQLLPRKKPAPGESAPTDSEDELEATPVIQMSEADAMKRIDEDVKEFFAVRNLEEADVYFTVLTEKHRFRLVDKLVGSALESKEADARLVAEFFARPVSQRECSLDVFEAGFVPMTEMLDDIAIDAPKAFEYMAIMLKGAGLDRDEERLKRVVEKAVDSDKLLQLVSS